MITRPIAETELWLDDSEVTRWAAAFAGERAARWGVQGWSELMEGSATGLVNGLLRWNDGRAPARRALVGQLGMRWTSWRVLVIEVWDGRAPHHGEASFQPGPGSGYRYFAMARLRVR